MLEKEPLMHLRLETKSYLRTKEPKTSVLHLKKRKKKVRATWLPVSFLEQVGLQVFRQMHSSIWELEVEAEYIQYFKISAGFAD